MERYENIRYYKELGSTNDFALLLIQNENAPEFTVIVAESQISGRGQRNNVWESQAEKNLLFSIIIYPEHVKASKQFIISECIALAVLKVVAEYTENVSVKWPNDIYVGEEKISGILIENSLRGSVINSTVIGVGLNCNQAEFSKSIPNPTSLIQHTKTETPLKDVLFAVLEEFEKNYELSKIDLNKVHEMYNQFLYKKDELALFSDENGEFWGKIRYVNKDGIIEIEDNLSKIRTYRFKEVAFLKVP